MKPRLKFKHGEWWVMLDDWHAAAGRSVTEAWERFMDTVFYDSGSQGE